MPPTVEEHGFRRNPEQVFEIESLDIAQWSPSAEPGPATQVHLLIQVRGLEAPMVMRFKGPDTLKMLIESLIRHRREVWPMAVMIQPDEILPPPFVPGGGRYA